MSTRLALFRRWWDTANKFLTEHEGARAPPMSFAIPRPNRRTRIIDKNGFSYRCPRAEGKQAFVDPYFDNEPQMADAYTAIAFSNRFDLADRDSGRHCGEFRIVFAKNSGLSKQVTPIYRNR